MKKKQENEIQQIMVTRWRRWGLLFVVYLLLCLGYGHGEENLKPCYHQENLQCPPNAMCWQVNSSNPLDLKCICLEKFQFNSKWIELKNDTANNTTTSSNINSTSIADLEQQYCVPSPSFDSEENKIVIYMSSAANPRHLVFGIILVLLFAILATGFLYILKVLVPWKRTKTLYKRLRNRRQNITPLQEMDELEMNRRYEMETFSNGE